MMKYLIGQLCGGFIEDPDFYFAGDCIIVEASNEDNAIKVGYEKDLYTPRAMCKIDKNNEPYDIDDVCSKNQCIKAIENCNEIIKGE